jgi:hypothetical protein
MRASVPLQLIHASEKKNTRRTARRVSSFGEELVPNLEEGRVEIGA